MEIQPPSSVAQATAPFTGLSRKQVEDTIRRIYPYRTLDTNLHSLNTREAISSSGLPTDFREREFIEGHRMLQGIVTNPWTSIHDIQQGKADPFYFDSGASDMEDILQKTIGKPTGAPDVNDPRLSFVENLMKLKQFNKGIDNERGYDYMKNLFLSQVEKGSTYYQTQAMRQNEGFTKHMMNKLQSRPPLDKHEILKNTHINKGMVRPHKHRYREVVINPTPGHQNNHKRAKLDDLHERFTSHIARGPPPSDGLSITTAGSLSTSLSTSRSTSRSTSPTPTLLSSPMRPSRAQLNAELMQRFMPAVVDPAATLADAGDSNGGGDEETKSAAISLSDTFAGEATPRTDGNATLETPSSATIESTGNAFKTPGKMVSNVVAPFSPYFSPYESPEQFQSPRFVPEMLPEELDVLNEMNMTMMEYGTYLLEGISNVVNEAVETLVKVNPKLSRKDAKAQVSATVLESRRAINRKYLGRGSPDTPRVPGSAASTPMNLAAMFAEGGTTDPSDFTKAIF